MQPSSTYDAWRIIFFYIVNMTKLISTWVHLISLQHAE